MTRTHKVYIRPDLPKYYLILTLERKYIFLDGLIVIVLNTLMLYSLFSCLWDLAVVDGHRSIFVIIVEYCDNKKNHISICYSERPFFLYSALISFE